MILSSLVAIVISAILMMYFWTTICKIISSSYIYLTMDKESRKELRDFNRETEQSYNRDFLIEHGQLNPQIICLQCQKSGFVHTKFIDKKVGISGAKATGAILTGGLSLLATGLSRKDDFTKAYCSNCNSTWLF